MPININRANKKPGATLQHFDGENKKNHELIFAHYKLDEWKIFKVTGVRKGIK